MKKTKLKLVGVCATTLLAVGVIAPSAAPIFGEVSTADAVVTANYLKDATYEEGTFSADELSQLLAVNVDVTTTDVGTAGTGIWAKLFPGATTTVAESIGLKDPTGNGYKVFLTTTLPTNTTLLQLNARTEAITLTFEIANSAGEKTGEKRTATINIASASVTGDNLVKAIGDEYKIEEGIKVIDVNGKELSYTDGDYTVTDISDEAFTPTYASTDYIKVVSGFKQRLKVSYTNSAGVTVDKIVERTITVNADENSTPILEVTDNPLVAGDPTNGQWIYYTSGSTVPVQYAFKTNALNTVPKEGNNEYLKSLLFDGIDTIDVDSDENPSGAVTLLGQATKDPNNALAGTATEWKFDASGVDFTKEGTYYYTVTIKNTAGAEGTFKVPVIVGVSDNMPVVSYTLGYAQDMTVEQDSSFSPFKGITFYENDDDRANGVNPIDASRVSLEGSVDTSKPGTYTLKYTVTNRIGNTLTVTRTITVAEKGSIVSVPVYRVYNKNNGDQLYTTSKDEYNWLVGQGWTGEGKSFDSASDGTAVYRLYNSNSGEHFYTTSVSEYNYVAAQGWTKEGVAFYSATEETGYEIFRLFNPNATGPGSHYFTKDNAEASWLVSQGWKEEGVAFYGLK